MDLPGALGMSPFALSFTVHGTSRTSNDLLFHPKKLLIFLQNSKFCLAVVPLFVPWIKDFIVSEILIFYYPVTKDNFDITSNLL
jgi:hypothetical protein